MSGHAVVIALDQVEPAYYEGWEARSRTSLRDGRDMLTHVIENDFSSSVFLTNENATRSNVLAAIAQALAKLVRGDLFLLYFSGHGAQLPRTEAPFVTFEAWCLHDGMLVDDEVNKLLVEVPTGIRIVTITDSCFSGGMPARLLNLMLEIGRAHV